MMMTGKMSCYGSCCSKDAGNTICACNVGHKLNKLIVLKIATGKPAIPI